MSSAPFGYPLRLDHLRYARNGSIPQYLFARRASGGLNHVLAHKRKTFARWGAVTSGAMMAGATGTQTIWRFRCRTGHAATHMAFVVGFVGASLGNGGADQKFEIDVTVAGGATTTVTVRPGDLVRTASAPGLINERRVETAVDADTTYEVACRKVNGCRVAYFLAYEKASREVDEDVDFYVELEGGLFEPVTDRIRERLLNYADVWKANGSHLLSWLGTRDGTSPTESGTAWVNVIDGNATISASTAGFYLGDGTITLEEWCRLSDNKTVDVVLAAHGSCAGGSTGEVRLANSGGTLCSLTGISTTSQWYSTTTTISALDTVSKADLQFRVAAGGSTLTLNAVSLYCYLA
jgi:hypothetical protein